MNSLFKNAFRRNPYSFEFSLESHTEGSEKKREDEIVIYAKINNFEGLKKANAKEGQEQWQVNAPFGRIRVRKTTKGDLEATYSQAIKTRDNLVGIAGGTEQNFPVDENVFTAFQQIADNGMIKDRYIFDASNITALDNSGKERIDTSGMKYEVDVYPDGKGGYHQWCKIDVEVNDLLDSVADVKGGNKQVKLTFDVSSLPFRPTEMILGSTQDPQEKAKITELYDLYFLAKKDENGNILQVAGDGSPEGEVENLDNDAQVVSTATQDEPVATATDIPVDTTDGAETIQETTTEVDSTGDEQVVATTDEAVDELPADDLGTDELPAEVADDAVDEVDTAIDAVQSAPVSTTEANKQALEPYIENLKGKSFEGRRSGNVIIFTDDNGQEHKLKSDWGVRGTNVVVDLVFDDDGEFTETIRKDDDGQVVKAEV